MKTNNPFEDLNISVNQKALFETYSYEANQLKQNKRIAILAKVVLADYDLNKVVKQYLENKVATNDTARISGIISSFNNYSQDVLESKIESINKSIKLIELIRAFYKEDYQPTILKEAISVFVNIIKEVYTIRELLDAYICDDKKQYKTLSFVLDIDLEENLITKLQLRDEKNNTQPLWKFSELYSWYETGLLPDLRNNRIRYMNPSLEMPAAQIYNAFIKKYFPTEDHDKLNNDENFRKGCLLDFAEKVVQVLWKNEPLFEEPVYLVRCNYTEKSSSQIEQLYKENIVSICIQDEEVIDQTYYNKLVNGDNPPYNKSLPYIHRFVTLANTVKQEDIIVIASYIGKDPKIGLLKKGEEIFCKERDGYKLYCLQMKSVYCTPNWGDQFDCVDLKTYPILKSIIPQQVTISAVKQRRGTIYGIYYGAKYPLNLSLMSDAAIETMCTEWLRSDFAEESIKVCYQIIQTGGNFADVDILGVNKNDEFVTAQVSNTTDINLVSKKIDKLNSFSSNQKIMFSMVYRPDLKSIDGCRNIFIGDIWDNFISDNFYKKMLERLASL